MDQPYEPPNSLPLDPPEDTPKKPDAGTAARLASCAALLVSIGLIGFFARYGTFEEAASWSQAPPVLRSVLSRIHEDNATVAAIVVSLIALLLSLTRLTSAARALAFPALIFVLMLAAVAAYLVVKSPF